MRVRMALSGRSPVAAARFSYMIDAGGRRDGAGHGRMRDDELENDLRPARAADLRRPAGQRMALDLSEQLAFAKRTISDHSDAAVPRQRKDAIFDLAVENVVGDLNEVERLGAHDPLDFAVPTPFRGGDSYIAEPADRLHREQRPQMLLPGEEIVDLQQIEPRHAPESAGGFDLVRAAGAGGDPDLVGRKQARRLVELGETVSNHLLGRAVHRRRIDQAPAGVEEGAHHLRAGVARDRVVADIEGDPTAEPHLGQLFAGRGYRLAEHASLLGRRELRAKQRSHTGGGQGTEQPAATEWGHLLHRAPSTE